MRLYSIYKWLIYVPGLLLSTFFSFLGVVITAVFSPRLASRWFASAWARSLLHMVPASLEIIEEHPLDSSQSYIVVANHRSLFDIPVLYGWLQLDLKWVMKKELRKVPMIGLGCERMGHIFLDRANRQSSMKQLQQVKKTLQPGTSIMFFPEGTRSRDGNMRPFKAGAFVMAKDLDLPILPVTVKDTDTIMPPDGLDLRPGRAQMIIHAPIPLEEVRELDANALRDKARVIIAESLEE